MSLLARAVPAAWLVLGAVAAQAQPPADGARDPLRTPACLDARRALDAAEAARPLALAQLRAARAQAARACLQAGPDAPARSRPDLPPLPGVVPAPAAAPLAHEPLPPRLRPPPPALQPAPLPAPPAQPAQVLRCDASGCWDSQGQRLQRAGPQLVDPQGRMCTQQGTVLLCR